VRASASANECERVLANAFEYESYEQVLASVHYFKSDFLCKSFYQLQRILSQSRAPLEFAEVNRLLWQTNMMLTTKQQANSNLAKAAVSSLQEGQDPPSNTICLGSPEVSTPNTKSIY